MPTTKVAAADYGAGEEAELIGAFSALWKFLLFLGGMAGLRIAFFSFMSTIRYFQKFIKGE